MRILSALVLTAWAAVVLQPAVGSWQFHHEETARIRTHLERVERAMRARDVSTLTPAQQQARAQRLDVLREYRIAGVFPHNHDFASREPYFIDRHSTRCAMAALIERAGGAALVQRVAKTANNARVRDLASDRELIAWLDRNGMTAAEAAWVQPSYGDPSPPFDDYVANGRDDSHILAHAAGVTVGLSGVLVNGLHGVSTKTRRAAIVYGALAGATSIAIGGTYIDEDTALGMVDVSLGIASLMAAIMNHNDLRKDPETGVAWRTNVRVSREGVPQLAVRVGF